MQKCVELAGVFGKKIWYDPTDVKKVWKIFDIDSLSKLNAFSPNMNEFLEYSKCLGVTLPGLKKSFITFTILDKYLENLESLGDFINTNTSFLQRVFPDQMELLLITMGVNGCLLLSRSSTKSGVQITTVPAPTRLPVISASGSGDCFNAGFLTAFLHGATYDSCMRAGQTAAGLSLKSEETVPQTINFDIVIKPFL